MVVQLDERLPNSLFGYTDYPSHQNHEWKEDFRNNAPQLLRQENVLASQYREDKQQPAENHEENQRGEGKTEDSWEGGMNVFQSNGGNIPEEKDKKEENDTGQDEQSNKDPLLRPNLQCHPLKIQISNSEVQMNQLASPMDNMYFNKFVVC
jgi:hypothetical protein